MPLPARRLEPALLCVLVAALPTQQSDVEVEGEIALARSLASEQGQIELAEQVLARAERGGVSPRMQAELDLARCDVRAEAARRQTDPAERDRQLTAAIAAYSAFLEEPRDPANRRAAVAALVGTATTLARSLAQRLEDATGDEHARLAQQLNATLLDTLSRTGGVIGALETLPEKSAADRAMYGELLLDRGTLLLLLAQTQVEPAPLFDQARAAFEKCANDHGEGSPFGLRAYVGIGDVLVARREWSEAADFYGFVTEFSVPADPAAWQALAADMAPEEKQRRCLFMQLATPGLIEALSSAGNAAEACKQGLRLCNVLEREGLELVAPYGGLAMLALARALMDAGGCVGGSDGHLTWYATREERDAATQDEGASRRTALEMALHLALETSGRNRGNVLQVRAQNLIAEIVARPGFEVAPAVLLEAAHGRYNDGDFGGAVEAYQRVLAALERADDSARTETGAEALHFLGRSLARLERHIEAALVFEEALDNWNDPDFDARNAQGFLEALQQVRRHVQGDPLVDALVAKASAAVESTRASEPVGEADYRRAEELYAQHDFAGALELFGQVPETAPSYEKALVWQGVCRLKQGEPALAERIFDDYLNHYVRDVRHATRDARSQTKRQEARATATFFWGLAAAEQERWQQVLDILGGYEDAFPEQAAFAPAALYRVQIAQQRLGQDGAAAATHARMLERYADSSWTVRASTDAYQRLRAEREALLGTDPARATGLLREMARTLQTANGGPAAPFENLRLESKHWLELGEWAAAEEVLERIVARFGAGAEAESVQHYVLPDLGRAYYEQREVQRAADTLRPLFDGPAKPTPETARVFARCLAGWAELSEEGGKPQIVRVLGGAAGAADFERATELYEQLSDELEKWTLPWLAVRFDGLYARRMWAELDTKQTAVLRRELQVLELELGPRFAELNDPNLRTLFQWLEELEAQR